MESKKLKAVTEARNMINQPILTKRDPDAVSKKFERLYRKLIIKILFLKLGRSKVK